MYKQNSMNTDNIFHIIFKIQYKNTTISIRYSGFLITNPIPLVKDFNISDNFAYINFSILHKL